MNTNTMELNMNEMEQINGGGRLGGRSAGRETSFSKKVSDWVDSTVIPAAVTFGKAVGTVSKAAYNWFTGLFD